MCQSRAQGGRRCPRHTKGARALMAVIRHNHHLDADQAEAIFTKTYRRARPAEADPTPEQWQRFLTARIEALAVDLDTDTADFDRLARALHAARHDTPDARLYAALTDLGDRAEKGQRALNRQIKFAAAIRGVDPETARERYLAFRAQYRRDFAGLPAAQRPDPPADWVQGFTGHDMMAVSTPADRATLYALYRCQADPNAFGDPTAARYASIDLETAGPAGRGAFRPENGCIIEVGIVEYDHTGAVVDQYEQLVAPASEVADQHGTGAVHIHGITMTDVAGAPSWAQVAPQVADRLQGRIMLAQNARFEKTWLGHHMTEAGQNFNQWGPTVDTMCLAQQHRPGLPNHQLATICESVGVDYTNGHRARHDAEVAARAFFALRAQVTAAYTACPVRAATPQPGPYRARRRRSPVTRVTADQATAAQAVDPWSTPPASDAA